MAQLVKLMGNSTYKVLFQYKKNTDDNDTYSGTLKIERPITLIKDLILDEKAIFNLKDWGFINIKSIYIESCLKSNNEKSEPELDLFRISINGVVVWEK